jgi:hypothetical protein
VGVFGRRGLRRGGETGGGLCLCTGACASHTGSNLWTAEMTSERCLGAEIGAVKGNIHTNC